MSGHQRTMMRPTIWLLEHASSEKGCHGSKQRANDCNYQKAVVNALD